MPIGLDFARIAALFSQPINLQMKTITDAFEELGKWLARRLKGTQSLERASRDFPVIDFYGDAVTLWIDTLQHGALGSIMPQHSFGESLRIGGQRLWEGLKRAWDAILGGDAIEEYKLIPATLKLLNDALSVVTASIDRFRTPNASMFTLGARTASDLFGEIALLFSATGKDMSLVAQFKKNLEAASGILKEGFAPKLPSIWQIVRGQASERDAKRFFQLLITLSKPQPKPFEQIADLLDMTIRYVVGAILLLPILPKLIEVVVRSASLSFKILLLEHFTQIQKYVSDFRRDMVNFFFVILMDYIDAAATYIAALGGIVFVNLLLLLRFIQAYANDLLPGLRTFTLDLKRFLELWTDVANALYMLFYGIFDIDLIPILLKSMGLTSLIPQAPHITLGDLVDLGNDATDLVKRAAMDAQLWVLEQTVGRLAPSAVSQRLKALRPLVHQFYTPVQLPPDAKPPDLSALHFPNLYDAFFGPGAVDIRGRLAALGSGLRNNLPPLFDTTIQALNQSSQLFRLRAQQAARVGSLAEYQRLYTQSAQLAHGIFGSQQDELRQRPAVDGVARAFDEWVINGGFYVIGAAIPLYVREMQQYWQEQKAKQQHTAQDERPTSPHILAKREQVGRVRVPRVIIHAPTSELDDTLIAEIVTQFSNAVVGAYQTGQRKLEGRATGRKGR